MRLLSVASCAHPLSAISTWKEAGTFSKSKAVGLSVQCQYPTAAILSICHLGALWLFISPFVWLITYNNTSFCVDHFLSVHSTLSLQTFELPSLFSRCNSLCPFVYQSMEYIVVGQAQKESRRGCHLSASLHTASNTTTLLFTFS